MKAVITENLVKQFPQGKRAVDGVSFALEQGEVFGFLGPNGAGKTTMVKLLGGMLTPTEGSCQVFDMVPSQVPEKVHAISGVVTEHAQMYDHLTGLDNLVFYGKIFGIAPAEGKKRAEALLEAVALSEASGQKLGTYSTGMRQRLSLARAMIHRPKILFLDEPTSGLDPESAQSVNAMIKGMAQNEGATIFLCTHQLRYAQEICSTYGLIDSGRLLATGNLEALRAMVSTGITVSIGADRMPEGMAARRASDGRYEVMVQAESDIPPLVRQVVEAGGSITHVSAGGLSLEEIYFALLKRRTEREDT